MSIRIRRLGSALTLALMALHGTLPLVTAQVPVQLPPRACTNAQLDVGFVRAEGAAGTILDVLQLTNISASTCILNGYVTVHMLDAVDAPMPTVDIPGGGIFANWPGPSPVALAPGASAPFGIAWSDVPTGSETTCPQASSLNVTPPGQTDPLNIALPSLAPCNAGRINVGPLRPPGSAIPS
jgi:hypothetical protein